MFGALSLPVLIIAALGIAGLGSCVYKSGRDSRQGEIQELRTALDVAKADNASLSRDVQRKDEIIVRQNTEVERLDTIAKGVRGLQATIRKEAQERQSALDSRLALLATQAGSGTESGTNCPKTYGILGDLADTMRDGVAAPVAVPKPAPVPASTQPPITAPAAPKPVLPAKPLPPAIRVKP